MTRHRSLAPSPQFAAPGFTLFELIVAIALSTTLLMLLGTAINLYLLRVDAGRTRVEEAQLARSILAMIAADVRSTTVYQTQDISSATQLANSASSFNVDSIDKKLPQGSGTGGSSSSGSGSSGASSQGVTKRTTAKGAAAPGPTAPTSGSSAGAGATGGSGGSGNSSSGNSSNSNSNDQNTDTMQPGVNGSLEEMIIDVNHLPRLDELFPANAQTTATTTSAANARRPSDIKTIRYFVRQGDAIDPSDVAATSLAPDTQARAGGLVRQTIDRAVRATAEQSGNSAVLDGGQVLVAPEVVAVEFHYFDGTGAVEEWNMQQAGSLPQAVEVRLWISSSNTPAAGTTIRPGSPDSLSGSHMYSQTIDLPLAQAAGSNASAANDNTGSGTDGFGSGASSTSGTGSGSGGTSTQ